MSLLHPDRRPVYQPKPHRTPWPWRLAGLVSLALLCFALVAGALVGVQVVRGLQEPGGMEVSRPAR